MTLRDLGPLTVAISPNSSRLPALTAKPQPFHVTPASPTCLRTASLQARSSSASPYTVEPFPERQSSDKRTVFVTARRRTRLCLTTEICRYPVAAVSSMMTAWARPFASIGRWASCRTIHRGRWHERPSLQGTKSWAGCFTGILRTMQWETGVWLRRGTMRCTTCSTWAMKGGRVIRL